MARPLPEVRVGQIWGDNDKRERGRTIKVVELEEIGGQPYVVVEVLTMRHGVVPPKPRQTRIAQKRFVPNSTGYSLIQDAQ